MSAPDPKDSPVSEAIPLRRGSDARSTTPEHEELVLGIINAVPGGVVHVLRDGQIKAANPEALRILGMRYDDIQQRYTSDWDPETLYEDGSPCPVEAYPVSQVLTTGRAQPPMTIGVRRPDGETSWAVFRAVPLKGADGELAGAVVTFLDITERRKSEEELRRSEEKWRSLAENLPDFVCIVDADARFVFINRVLPHLSEEAIAGASVYEYMDEGGRDTFRRHFALALETRKPQRFESRGEGPEGKLVLYETTLVPLAPGASGTIERLVLVARDVTERRAMLASLAEKERLASVGMLASTVAHEIMNPLTYVLANIELAETGRNIDEERRGRALDAAREGVERMQQIVRDLRTLGRAGGGELFYVDVRSVMETALRLAGGEVAGRATLELALAEVPSVLASESRLCQVFLNLLVNAVQAMDERPEASRVLRVETKHDESAGFVVIAISDTGEGIPAARQRRIFEPFFTTKRNGTGLGLWITRDIVDTMGGRIEVESTPGIGTTFTVFLSTTRSKSTEPRSS